MSLNYKVFREYVHDLHDKKTKAFSLLDLLLDHETSGDAVRLMEVFNPLVEYESETNSIDPRELKQNEESIEVVEIQIIQSEGFLIVSLHDISESQHKGTRRLQKLF
jgi:hypothetical protein